eukprot:GHVN01091356.1.p1 GENE.GHVN01091356.1~~GHVN01091356.1.p1  ORF type:complete len:299 (-),score=50.66 GHVN01091356.1:446-1342(-)
MFPCPLSHVGESERSPRSPLLSPSVAVPAEIKSKDESGYSIHDFKDSRLSALSMGMTPRGVKELKGWEMSFRQQISSLAFIVVLFYYISSELKQFNYGLGNRYTLTAMGDDGWLAGLFGVLCPFGGVSGMFLRLLCERGGLVMEMIVFELCGLFCMLITLTNILGIQIVAILLIVIQTNFVSVGLLLLGEKFGACNIGRLSAILWAVLGIIMGINKVAVGYMVSLTPPDFTTGYILSIVFTIVTISLLTILWYRRREVVEDNMKRTGRPDLLSLRPPIIRTASQLKSVVNEVIDDKVR